MTDDLDRFRATLRAAIENAPVGHPTMDGHQRRVFLCREDLRAILAAITPIVEPLYRELREARIRGGEGALPLPSDLAHWSLALRRARGEGE